MLSSFTLTVIKRSEAQVRKTPLGWAGNLADGGMKGPQIQIIVPREDLRLFSYRFSDK